MFVGKVVVLVFVIYFSCRFISPFFKFGSLFVCSSVQCLYFVQIEMNRAIRKTVNQEFERLLVEVTRNFSPDSAENKRNKTTTKTKIQKKRNEKRKILIQK